MNPTDEYYQARREAFEALGAATTEAEREAARARFTAIRPPHAWARELAAALRSPAAPPGPRALPRATPRSREPRRPRAAPEMAPAGSPASDEPPAWRPLEKRARCGRAKASGRCSHCRGWIAPGARVLEFTTAHRFGEVLHVLAHVECPVLRRRAA